MCVCVVLSLKTRRTNETGAKGGEANVRKPGGERKYVEERKKARQGRKKTKERGACSGGWQNKERLLSVVLRIGKPPPASQTHSYYTDDSTLADIQDKHTHACLNTNRWYKILMCHATLFASERRRPSAETASITSAPFYTTRRWRWRQLCS